MGAYFRFLSSVIYKDRSIAQWQRKDLFDTVKFNEFSFLLDVYKMRPGFQLEKKMKSKKMLPIKLINYLTDKWRLIIVINLSQYLERKIYATILSQAVRNRDNGDFGTAGFYNNRPKNLMKSKAVSLHLDCILLLLILTLASHFREEHIDYFKTKTLIFAQRLIFWWNIWNTW